MNSANAVGKMPPVIYGLRTSIDPKGSLGVLFDGFGREFAVWADGVSPETGEHVIPEGKNKCKKSFYHHGGYPTFEILVPKHGEVLFHKGNKKSDSKACVLVAEKFSFFDNAVGVAESKEGFEEFWNLYKEFDEITFEVINFPIQQWAK